MDSRPSERLAKYRLLMKLAKGGMGEVHLASQKGPEGFERLVVLKRMLPSTASDRELIKAFLDEARLVAGLSHRNIAQILELGEDAAGFFLAMDYVKGPSLRRIIREMARCNEMFPPALALDIAAQVADALGYAYAATTNSGKPLRIVHRDVSPENVLVSVAGDVKLIDFGVAKSRTQQHATSMGVVKGKLSYMSPEQTLGRPLDGRSDLFSLGIVLCEAVGAEHPFRQPDMASTIWAIQNGAPRLPSADDPDLAFLDAPLSKLLAKSPADRYSDANQAAEDLLAVRARLPPPPKRLGPWMTERFGAEVAELLKSVVEPDPQSSPSLVDAGAPLARVSAARHASGSHPVEVATRPDRQAAGLGGAQETTTDHAVKPLRPSWLVPLVVGGIVGALGLSLLAALLLRKPPAPIPKEAALVVPTASPVVLPSPPPLELSPSSPSLQPAALSQPPVAVSPPASPAPLPLSPTGTAAPPKEQKPARHTVLSKAPARGKVAEVSGQRGDTAVRVRARYERVRAAWAARRSGSPEVAARLYDQTLESIARLVADGGPEDIADAKRSLDDFVASALRGVEP